MDRNINIFLSSDLISILKKSRSAPIVSIVLDGKRFYDLTVTEPLISLRLSHGAHTMAISCTIEEICVVFNYNSKFDLTVDDDFSVEIYKAEREYKLLARRLLDFSREELTCLSATFDRTVTNDKPYGEGAPRTEVKIDRSYRRGITLHTCLIFLTFGVYYAYWVYKTTVFTNYVEYKPQRSPKKMTILCTLVPFYFLAWNLETAQRLDKMAAEMGISSDLETVWQVGSFYLAFAMPTFFQRKINQIVRRVILRQRKQLRMKNTGA